MRILTDKLAWQSQFDKLQNHSVFYTTLDHSHEHLQATCDELAIDIVLGLEYQNIMKFSLAFEKVQQSRVPWLIPNPVAAQMEDKFFGHQWFVDNGFNDYLPAKKGIQDFPYLLKSGNGTGGNFVDYIADQTMLDNIDFDPDNCLIQAYITSPYEYAHHFLAHEGQVIKSVTYEHDFRDKLKESNFYIRGQGCHNSMIKKYSLPVMHTKLLDELINKLNYSGFGCVDFKLDEGRLVIIELNTRMGGSLLYYDHLMHDLDDFLITYHQLCNSLS